MEKQQRNFKDTDSGFFAVEVEGIGLDDAGRIGTGRDIFSF